MQHKQKSKNRLTFCLKTVTYEGLKKKNEETVNLIWKQAISFNNEVPQ